LIAREEWELAATTTEVTEETESGSSQA